MLAVPISVAQKSQARSHLLCRSLGKEMRRLFMRDDFP
jgi:hypothetical protein